MGAEDVYAGYAVFSSILQNYFSVFKKMEES